MPKIFNKDTIDSETLSDGALRRVLLDGNKPAMTTHGWIIGN